MFMQESPGTMERIGVAEVSEYARQAKAALGNVLIEERGPIEDLVEGTLSGENIAEGGPPGSGKTLSMNTLLQLVGATEDQMAVVPGVSDLAPGRLIGGETRKRIVDPSGEMDERLEIIETPGLITAETVYAKFDEYPRLGKRAREAVLPILEERKIRNSAGRETYLPNLLGVMATMNRPDSRVGLQSAESRRFAVGTMFDAEDEERQRAKSMGVVDLGDAHRIQIQPIATASHVRAIQNTVRSNRDSDGRILVTYPTTLKQLGYEYQKIIKTTVEGLRPDSESTTSMSVQMARLALARAMANEESEVKKEHVLRAAQRIVTARIIMLGGNGNVQQLVREKHQELTRV